MKVPRASQIVWTALDGERWYYAGIVTEYDGGPPLTTWSRGDCERAARYPSRRQAIGARAMLLADIGIPTDDLRTRRQYRVEPASPG